jgi:hypothetical protein
MDIPDPWAAVEVALRLIKTDLDADEIKAAKELVDPDWHRAFYERMDQQNILGGSSGAAAPGAPQRRSGQQIQYLRKALRRTVPALRQIKPQAWIWLRLAAYSHGVTLPSNSDDLIEQLQDLLAAANEIGKGPRGRPRTLRLERAVAGACAAVCFGLTRKCPTTSHPDQRVKTVDPYHALVEAVFEGWHFDHWEDRAKEAAVAWRAAMPGS